MSFASRLSFNPLTRSLVGSDGKAFQFSGPTGNELPPRGYDPGEETFQPAPGGRVAVNPKSDRPQPFGAWDGKTPTDLPILIKVKVKCSKSSFWSFTLGVYSL